METVPQVLEIPLSQISPNPDNPRHSISQEEIDAMAASLAEIGQKTPIKVRRISQDKYELVGGHIRLMGAQKAKLETLRAWVMELTPEQALEEAIYDNRNQPMGWLDNYVSIETLMALNPNLIQQQVADRLEVSQKTVSRALKLLSLLSPTSREAIYTQGIKSGNSIQITEKAFFQLTGLAKGAPDDQSQVVTALKVVLERRMPESQA